MRFVSLFLSLLIHLFLFSSFEKVKKRNKEKNKIQRVSLVLRHSEKNVIVSKKTLPKKKVFQEKKKYQEHREKKIEYHSSALLTPQELLALKVQVVPPQYPIVSMRRGEKGEVIVEIIVKEGLLKETHLLKTSGYKRLDREVLSSLKKWSFPKTFSQRFQQKFIFK